MSVALAIRARDASALPGKRDEDWRWTDLRGLIRQVPDPSAPYAGDPPPGPFDAIEADAVHILANGGRAEIDVPAGQLRTVRLRIAAQGAGAHASQVEVRVGEGATLRLLESHDSDDASLAHTAFDFHLAAGASVERIVVADDHPEAVNVAQAEVRITSGGQFAQNVFTTGARRQRLETGVHHPGQGAIVRLDGVYLLEGKAHADLTTIVTHAGRDGRTEQLTKGVVRDQARGVFQGRIVVAEGADGTDARMGHHALIVSDRAEVDAKPELEIYADDVSCAHGNTVGALDEDALFYARQRGIPEAEARAMLTEAFVGEVVDRVAFAPARDVAAAWVAARLRGA